MNRSDKASTTIKLHNSGRSYANVPFLSTMLKQAIITFIVEKSKASTLTRGPLARYCAG
ncbi:MAG: hypothetical protein ACR5K4_02900 [Sodalis sp. (in: enterobacteria)]